MTDSAAPDSMELEIDLQNAASGAAVPETAEFRRWAEAALRGRREQAELSIRVVDEAEGRALNHQYRQRDYATNVLSFPADLPSGLELPLLGDLVLCAPVVAREAAEQNKPEPAHWAHLTVHGILHLLGYDHMETAEAEAMEALETEILARLGFPDPYRIS